MCQTVPLIWCLGAKTVELCSSWRGIHSMQYRHEPTDWSNSHLCDSEPTPANRLNAHAVVSHTYPGWSRLLFWVKPPGCSLIAFLVVEEFLFEEQQGTLA